MTIEHLRQAHQARPFRAFTLLLADGRAISVKHPEFLSQSQSGRMAYVSTEDDRLKWIDLLLVTALEFHDGKTKKRRQAK